MEVKGILNSTGTRSGAQPSTSKGLNVGVVIGSIIGGSAVLLSAICLPFVTPALRRICLPYVPATNAQVTNVFRALKGQKGKLVDLGSGDGRIVVEASRRGFKGVGVELNYWLVLYSTVKALRLGLSSSATFYWKNIWKFHLEPYQNVVIFGVDVMMPDLENKCRNELKAGAVVVACRYPFPNLLPSMTIGEGIDTVWLYTFPAKPLSVFRSSSKL